MREQLLAAIAQYGSPALFATLMIASIGAPLPIALLLIVTGSLTAQGAMSLGGAIGIGGAGSVLGDLIGYAIGRWGGAAIVNRFSSVLKRQKLEEVEARARRNAALYIFLTRWILSPLGPWVNLASGIARYPYTRFAMWVIAGDFLSVAIYVSLGRFFSDRVMALDSVLGDLTGALVALVFAVFIGRTLVKMWAA